LQHDSSVRVAIFSPDGKRIVTGSKVRAARIWDAHTGQALTEPMMHNDAIRCATFSSDGSRVAIGSADKTARVWDAMSGQPLTEPLLHDGEVVGVEFSPDGRRMATASGDGRVRLWDVPPVPVPVPTWLPELAEAIAGRRWESNRTVVTVPLTEVVALRKQLTTSISTDFHTRWAQWFFGDRTTRSCSPFLTNTNVN
jgi:WD40 repeat protein